MVRLRFIGAWIGGWGFEPLAVGVNGNSPRNTSKPPGGFRLWNFPFSTHSAAPRLARNSLRPASCGCFAMLCSYLRARPFRAMGSSPFEARYPLWGWFEREAKRLMTILGVEVPLTHTQIKPCSSATWPLRFGLFQK